jgi:hypothetical protein
MGREPERIGVAFALELHCAQVRQALDVVAQSDESVDAFEECGQAHGARGKVEQAGGRGEADARDLAGADGDGEMDGRLVIADHAFDVDALGGVLECGEAFFAEDRFHYHRHAASRGLGGHTRRVVREEAAQDDPEPVHALSMELGFGPAESARRYPTSLWAWRLILLEAGEVFLRIWEGCFPGFWAAVSTASWFDRLTMRPPQRLSSRASRGRDPGSIDGVSGWRSGSRIALRASGMTSGGGVRGSA